MAPDRGAVAVNLDAPGAVLVVVPVVPALIGRGVPLERIGEAGDVDTSMIILKLASGALCHIDCSRRADYGYDERVEVFGSKGLALSDRKPRREVTLYQGEKIVSDGLHPGWFERMEPTFYHALDAFIKAVRGEKTEYPTLWDGLMAQVIAEAAVDSLKTNQPVKISYWSAEKRIH